MVTQIPSGERDSLLQRFTNELLDANEQRRVLSILATTADAELAGRVFERACDIRRGLTIGPGQDMPKWNLFRQLKDLLAAIAPKIFVEGRLPKLEGDADETELDLLTDVLAKFNPTPTDLRTALPDEARRKLHAYLKRAVERPSKPESIPPALIPFPDYSHVPCNLPRPRLQLLQIVLVVIDGAQVCLDHSSLPFQLAEAVRVLGDEAQIGNDIVRDLLAFAQFFCGVVAHQIITLAITNPKASSMVPPFGSPLWSISTTATSSVMPCFRASSIASVMLVASTSVVVTKMKLLVGAFFLADMASSLIRGWRDGDPARATTREYEVGAWVGVDAGLKKS